MAKAKTLAALAGLAGLAYAMRNKDKGMTPEQNDTLANANRVSKMSDDSDTLARVNRNMSPGQSAVDDTNAGVLNAITAPKKVEDTSNYSNEGRSAISVSNPVSAKAKPRGMTAKQNDMLATANRNRLTDEKIGKGRRMASGGMTASSRADGCATKGKTKGRFV